MGGGGRPAHWPQVLWTSEPAPSLTLGPGAPQGGPLMPRGLPGSVPLSRRGGWWVGGGGRGPAVSWSSTGDESPLNQWAGRPSHRLLPHENLGPGLGSRLCLFGGFDNPTPTSSSSQSSEVNSQPWPDAAGSIFFLFFKNKLKSTGLGSFSREELDTEQSTGGQVSGGASRERKGCSQDGDTGQEPAGRGVGLGLHHQRSCILTGLPEGWGQ